VAVSTQLFQILTKDGFLATIICAISKHRYKPAGLGFVDDVNLCITVPNGTGEQVVKWMQQSINMWVGLLQATSKALVPEKCFWYYIHNTWSQGRWQYSPNPTSQEMHVPDDNNAPIRILELPPLEV